MKHSEILSSTGGITTTLGFDENSGMLLVKNSADIQANLDQNKEIRNDNLGRGKNMRKVASIPLHVLYELQAMWKANDIDPKVGLKKFLNDPDMAYFRTDESKV